jgi:hypothetical protein
VHALYVYGYDAGAAVPHLPRVLVHDVGAREPPHHHAHHCGGAGQGQVPQVLARPRQVYDLIIVVILELKELCHPKVIFSSRLKKSYQYRYFIN